MKIKSTKGAPRKIRSRIRLLLTLPCVALSAIGISASSAHAASGTWLNLGSNWTTNDNWNGATYPGTTSTSDIATLATAADVVNPNLASSVSINALKIDNSGADYSITTGNSSTLSINATENSIVITGGGTTNIAPQVIFAGHRVIDSGTTALNFTGGIGLNGLSPDLTLTNSTAITASNITTLNGTTATTDVLRFEGTGSINVTGSIAPGTGTAGVKLESLQNYSGTVTLSGANTFSAATNWRAGTLAIGNNAALGGQALTLGTSSSGALANSVLTTGAFTASSNISFLLNSTGTSFTIGGSQTTGTSTYSGTVDLTNLRAVNNGLNVTSALGGTVEFTGVISGSTAANHFIKKIGDGTVVFSGANTYAGTTTVDDGTLKVDSGATGTGRLANTSGITVNNGGTLLLAQSGTASTDRINNSAAINLAGGKLDTGGLSEVGAGTLSSTTNGVGTLTLSANSTLDFGAGSSSIIQFGGIAQSVDNTVLAITNWNGVPSMGNGTERLLFSGNATSFTSLFDQNEVSFNGVFGYTAVQFGTNSYYEITAVPEPATVLGALALVGLIGFRERRRVSALWHAFSRVRTT
jgi:fibronectin-binding autotransporter adhesin